MSRVARQQFHDLIRASIAAHGHHITLVQGGPLPRYAYTIGANPPSGVEYVLAGAAWFTADEVRRVLGAVVESHMDTNASVAMDGLGRFVASPVHPSWSTSLMLGVLDYYDTQHIEALQVVPEDGYWTIDVPRMAEA